MKSIHVLSVCSKISTQASANPTSSSSANVLNFQKLFPPSHRIYFVNGPYLALTLNFSGQRFTIKIVENSLCCPKSESVWHLLLDDFNKLIKHFPFTTDSRRDNFTPWHFLTFGKIWYFSSLMKIDWKQTFFVRRFQDEDSNSNHTFWPRHHTITINGRGIEIWWYSKFDEDWVSILVQTIFILVPNTKNSGLNSASNMLFYFWITVPCRAPCNLWLYARPSL